MRTFLIGTLAVVGVAIASPALAQGVYVGAGPAGVGVGVGPGPGYYGDWHRHYAYDDDAVVVRRHHCRVVIVHRYGEVQKIRRCW